MLTKLTNRGSFRALWKAEEKVRQIMTDRKKLDSLFEKHGYTDFEWINTKNIVVSQWVRLKCIFGCKNYGRNASCPPTVPSVSECRQFFDEYETAVIFRFEKTVDKPEDRGAWSKEVNQRLLELEREVFLSGYQKAFLLVMDSCHLCADCSAIRDACKNPKLPRPSPESMAIDVFSTVRQFGFPIEVLSDYTSPMNRYAFLMID
jgi:predicted metal-binding protein